MTRTVAPLLVAAFLTVAAVGGGVAYRLSSDASAARTSRPAATGPAYEDPADVVAHAGAQGVPGPSWQVQR